MGINDLKKNSIGNQKPVDPYKNEEGVIIDYTSNTSLKQSLDHNKEVANETVMNSPKPKTFVKQEPKAPEAGSVPLKQMKVNVSTPPKRAVQGAGTSANTPTTGRVEFDLTSLPQEEPDENIHTSIEDDILTGKNPILYDYIKEKKEEMDKWIEEKEDERKLKEANGELEEPVTTGVSFDLTQPANDEETTTNDDSLSLEKYESSATVADENVTYNMIDDLDLGDNNMGEEVFSNHKEVDIEEINTISKESDEDKALEIIDDLATDEVVFEEEPTIDTTEEAVADVDTLDNTTTENVGEVEDTPEEDKYVSSEGIEFQDTAGIKGEDINNTPIEDETNRDSTSPAEMDEGTKRIIEQASKVLKPVAKKLDLSSFTVVKKAGTTNKLFEQKQINVAKWVLRNKRCCIHMKASQGSELEELRSLMQEANVVSDYIRMYRIVYDHIVSPKPNSFEAWCKTTYADDLDDYFFCFFIANYKGSNYIPYDCPNKECKPGTFLSENIPIMDMVKFGSDKDKAEFNDIYKSEIFDSNEKGLYVTERVPFSDKVAIAFKQSTIYSFIEAQSISNNESFIQKYAGAISIAPNVDDIYLIDIENRQLIPVQYKVYPDSNANTYKSKIQKYDSILRSLTPDEFGSLSTYVNEFNSSAKKGLDIKYVRPATTCPDCGASIAEETTTAQSLVFFRYQLGLIASTSVK